jgi:hypothetical protein
MLPSQLKKYPSLRQIIQIIPRYIDLSASNLKLIGVIFILMKISNKYSQYLERIEKQSFYRRFGFLINLIFLIILLTAVIYFLMKMYYSRFRK